MSTAGPELPKRRRSRSIVVAVAVGLALALAILPLVGFGWSALYHQGCANVRTVAQEFLWTPYVVGESPYGGRVHAEAIVYQTSTTTVKDIINVTNGTAEGYFYLDEWQVSESLPGWIPGPGDNHPCKSIFFADDLSRNPGFGQAPEELPLDILGEGNLSDAAIPTNFSYPALNSTQYPSVQFDFSFPTSLSSTAYGYVNSCAETNTTYRLTTSTVLNFLLPSPRGTSLPPIPATLPIPTTYTYSFPPGLGNWTYFDLTHGMDLPEGGLAFSYAPC